MTFDQRLFSRVWSLEYGAAFRTSGSEPMHIKHHQRTLPRPRLFFRAAYRGAVPNNLLSMGRLAGRRGCAGRGMTIGADKYAVERVRSYPMIFGRDNAVWLSGTINSQALVQSTAITTDADRLDPVSGRQVTTRMAGVARRPCEAARKPDPFGGGLLQTDAQPAADLRQRRLPARQRRLHLRHGTSVRIEVMLQYQTERLRRLPIPIPIPAAARTA